MKGNGGLLRVDCYSPPPGRASGKYNFGVARLPTPLHFAAYYKHIGRRFQCRAGQLFPGSPAEKCRLHQYFTNNTASPRPRAGGQGGGGYVRKTQGVLVGTMTGSTVRSSTKHEAGDESHRRLNIPNIPTPIAGGGSRLISEVHEVLLNTP